MILGNRDLDRVAIHGGRRRKHGVLDTEARQGLEEADALGDVAPPVERRLGDGLADGDQPCEVDTGIDVLLLDNPRDGFRVADGGLVERDVAVDDLAMAPAEVVDDDYLLAMGA